MVAWFKRRKRNGSMLALCPAPGGVAAASVSHPGAGQPVLEWAEFVAADARDAGRADALARLLRDHAVDDVVTTSLLPLEAYNLVLIEAPPVPDAELRQAVRFRVRDLIDFNIEEAVVDVFEVPPLKGGRDNMLYAVVAHRSAVRGVIDEIEALDLELATVDIPELALRNLTALLPEDVGGVAFIYLDDRSGLITITRQQTLYLSRRFDSQRQRLLAAGPEITADIEGLLDAIVIEIQRSLDYYESQFAQPPVQGVVIAPLGQPVAGIDDYLASQLGIPARMLSLAGTIDSAAPLDAASEARCLTAIGAALRAREAAA